MVDEARAILPLACLAVGALAVYGAARLLPAELRAGRFAMERNGLLALFTALILAIAGAAWLPLFAAASTDWRSTAWQSAILRPEPGALTMIGIALGLGIPVTLYSGRYLTLDRRYATYYPMLLLLLTGLSGMVLSADLFTLYMFCELMSTAAYALVAFRRHTDTAIEAGFKYLIMGSVGTIVLLMGLSFIYRERGDLLLPVGVAETSAPAGLGMRVGIGCILVGLAIKSALVPVHTWLPDAHGRAPSSISALLSGVVIQSTFYALLKVSLGLGFPARKLGALLIGGSLLNMTLGNSLALVQTNTKRLLAYSTVAQMGYVMLSVGIGLRYRLPEAIQAGLFLLLAHAAMKGLAFLCKGVWHFYCGTTTIRQLRGMAPRLPLVTVSFGLALAGLAGIPPLAGFTGKWFVLSHSLAAADKGAPWAIYAGLAAFLLNGLLSLGYYLPLIGTLFASSPPGEEQRDAAPSLSLWMAVPLIVLAALVVLIGLYPQPWWAWMAPAGAFLHALGGW